MHFQGLTFSSASYSPIISKSNYGKETVSDIDVMSALRLNGTTVNGIAKSCGSIVAENATVKALQAGGNITFTDTQCNGPVESGGSIISTRSTADSLKAGGSISVDDSKILNNISAGSFVNAHRCEILKQVSGSSVVLNDCPNVEFVKGGSRVVLQHTHVSGDVSSGGTATVKNSMISGCLTCSMKHLVIEGSTIETIRLPRLEVVQTSQSQFNFSGGTFINCTFGSNVSSSNVSDSVVVKQMIELRNCKVGSIIFEGGDGEVILLEGAELTGTITGGKLKS